MPPRISLTSLARALPVRPRPAAPWSPLLAPVRPFSDAKDPPYADRSTRTDTEPLPTISEEAAQTTHATGGTGPEVNKGTPVEEVRWLR